MGGLRKYMPVTFAVYAVGMLALCGFPLFFSGFWSKDEILHAAHDWPSPRCRFTWVLGALLTAFYMTRQVCYVFFGAIAALPASATPTRTRGHTSKILLHHGDGTAARKSRGHDRSADDPGGVRRLAGLHRHARVAVVPIRSSTARTAGRSASPASRSPASSRSCSPRLCWSSSASAWAGASTAASRSPRAEAPDAAGQASAAASSPLLGHAFYIDALYGATLIRLNTFCVPRLRLARPIRLDGAVRPSPTSSSALRWLDSSFDTYVVNPASTSGCEAFRAAAGFFSLLQDGRVQTYLRVIGVALVALVIFLLWGAKAMTAFPYAHHPHRSARCRRAHRPRLSAATATSRAGSPWPSALPRSLLTLVLWLHFDARLRRTPVPGNALLDRRRWASTTTSASTAWAC